MPPEVISLTQKLSTFSDHWNPRIVGSYNGNEIRVVKVEGGYSWHSHAETDELFLPLAGTLTIEFRDGVRHLRPGEMVIVPKGVEHRPVADEECQLLVLDREGEPTTGLNPSEFTRAKLERI